MTTLTVVIPATDEPPTLARALAAVERAENGPEEVIVVDRPRKIGPAAARNRGAAGATQDVLVFIDADVEVHEDTFTRIRRAFDDEPTLAAVFGSYDDAPGSVGVVSDFRNLLHHHVHQLGGGPATTFWAGLGALRRSVFSQFDGFDERFQRPSVEDIELGMRLAAAGARVRLDPAIQGKHLKRWTFRSMVKTDLLDRGVPWLLLVVRRRSSSSALNLGWSNRVATAASIVFLVALVRRNAPTIAAIVVLLLILDRRFYALLARRGGPRLVMAGFPLHITHRVTAAAALPIVFTNLLLRRS
jgi:glycosyltransferase involved in cell wall biosynthesis